MAPTRVFRCIPGIAAVAILLVLIARIVESSSLAAQEFVRTGLLYDKICYMGSYLIDCPYTTPTNVPNSSASRKLAGAMLSECDFSCFGDRFSGISRESQWTLHLAW